MKMRFWDRVLMIVGSLLSFCAGVIAVIYGVMLYERELGEGVLLRIAPTALIVSGAVVVLFAAFDLLLPRRYNPRRRSFIIQPTEHGELRIAVSAIENLILKCVETHKEVRVISMSIVNRRGAVNVALRVAMNSNVSIPHAVEQLQTQIKRYLAASSGIEVRDIDVSIERATGDEGELTREALENAVEVPPSEIKAEAPAREEKLPLHQRIFGRDAKKPPLDAHIEDIAAKPSEATDAQAEAEKAETAPQPFDAVAEAAQEAPAAQSAPDASESDAPEADTAALPAQDETAPAAPSARDEEEKA